MKATSFFWYCIIFLFGVTIGVMTHPAHEQRNVTVNHDPKSGITCYVGPNNMECIQTEVPDEIPTDEPVRPAGSGSDDSPRFDSDDSLRF